MFFKISDINHALARASTCAVDALQCARQDARQGGARLHQGGPERRVQVGQDYAIYDCDIAEL